MQNIIICGRKFISCRVSANPIRLAKCIHINGYYYEFAKTNDTYSIELAVAQLKQLQNYEMVFFYEPIDEQYVGIFIKHPTRKAIFINKANFYIQILKYKELFGTIAIINDTELYDNTQFQENINGFYNVDFVAIEKLPDLLDPSKKQALIRKYLATAVFTVFAYSVYSFVNNDLASKLTQAQNNLTNETTQFLDLTKKIKSKAAPTLPSKEEQNKQLAQCLEDINKGVL